MIHKSLSSVDKLLDKFLFEVGGKRRIYETLEISITFMNSSSQTFEEYHIIFAITDGFFQSVSQGLYLEMYYFIHVYIFIHYFHRHQTDFFN